MKLLKPATNKMAYAKVGIYGTAGSGKTRTATEIAIGLHKAIGSKKPIAAFDTEPAPLIVRAPEPCIQLADLPMRKAYRQSDIDRLCDRQARDERFHSPTNPKRVQPE